MPYIYEASKKAVELTVKFQKYSKKIPLPLLVILFKNLAHNIASIFSAYDNDALKMQGVLSGLITKESNLSDTEPAYKQVVFLHKLRGGDLNSFKLCAEGYKDVSDDSVVSGYAQTFGKIIFSHLFNIHTEILTYNMPKGRELKKLLMWSEVDPKELEASRNKENVAEEKEQRVSDKKTLGFGL